MHLIKLTSQAAPEHPRQGIRLLQLVSCPEDAEDQRCALLQVRDLARLRPHGARASNILRSSWAAPHRKMTGPVPFDPGGLGRNRHVVSDAASRVLGCFL